MKTFRWRSLNVLVIAGFALVGLPLILAMLLTTRYVDQLAELSSLTLHESVGATRHVQQVSEQIAAMERNARQYAVLGDPALLELHAERRKRMESAAQAIAADIDDNDVHRLSAELVQLGEQQARALAGDSDIELENYSHMLDVAAALRIRVQELTEIRTATLDERATQIRQTLLWVAGAVIPLSLLVAAIFTLLISRALRQLVRSIGQLGQGRFDRQVTVGGPADFQRLGEQLDWLRRRLLALEADKNTFLSHVSHELKTPLANIRESSDLLADETAGTLSAEQREVIDILRENGITLQNHIENLLNFNAWQNLRQPMQREAVELDQLAAIVLTRHRLAVQSRELVVQAELEPLTINGDRKRLDSMLDNLVSNAVKFSPRQGRLLIRIHRENRAAIVIVGDDGPGIPAAERDQVFESFYRGSNAADSRIKGTGIGLSIVRDCVVRHDGDIEIIEGVTRGATLHIRLPLDVDR